MTEEAREGGARPQRRYPDRRQRGRGYRRRRRVCAFCVDKVTEVDYKQQNLLRPFISDRGRILSRRRTGTCAKHQRQLARAIKRARFLGLLPFVAERTRLS